MPRDSGGTFTYDTGEGPSTVGGTTIESENWANPSFTSTAEALSDSLSRTQQGVMTRALIVPDIDPGTGLPSLGFASETNSGWRRDGTSDVVFQLAGENLIRYFDDGVSKKMYVWVGGVWSEVVTSATPSTGFSGFANGTEAAPGAYFASDNFSGMWLNTAVSAGVVSMSAGATESMRWNNGVSQVENDNGDNWRPVVGCPTPTTGQIMRATGAGNDWEPTSAISITSGGLVGIGPATVNGTLDVNGVSTFQADFTINANLDVAGVISGDGSGITNLDAVPEAPTDGAQYGRVGQTASWTPILDSVVQGQWLWSEATTGDPGTGNMGGNAVNGQMDSVTELRFSETTANGGGIPPDALYQPGDIIYVIDEDRNAFGRYDVVTVVDSGAYKTIEVIASPSSSGNPGAGDRMDVVYVPQAGSAPMPAAMSYGIVDSTGALISGSGDFTPSRSGVGEYGLNFDVAASAVNSQVVVVQPLAFNPTALFVPTVLELDASNMLVEISSNITSGEATPLDAQFMFTRIRY